MAEALAVELQQTGQGWQLTRDGEPFLIRGAGGDASFEALAAAGANAVRTWAADDIDDLLDEAHANGLAVAVGIWLGHERHGFDYSDKQQVAEQFAKARQAVLRYKDHPAVLLWGVGNEMEGFDAGDNPAIWSAVNDIAAMIKELDPNHPTMTVTAEIGAQRIASINEFCPAIDIHGINAYGGAQSLPERYRAAGGKKPYIITEFGPRGPWESATTEWGAPLEMTSTEKAEFYTQTYTKAVLQAPYLALGSFAFTWGHKMEGTATWFGMFLADDSRLATIDAMTLLWSGESPDNLAPHTEPLRIEGNASVDPGERVTVKVAVSDPDGDPVEVRWALRPESGEYATGGDFRPKLPEIEDAIVAAGEDGVVVEMPESPGAYRLFMYAYDGAGNAATANIPLHVKGEVGARFPVVVYDETFYGLPWVPSGWMGSIDKLTLEESTDNPYDGKHSIRMRYEGVFDWVGIAWQDPPNNWGDMEGGYDLSGATELQVWARGEYGGEKIGLGVGLIEDSKPHPDSGKTVVSDIVLTREWQLYRVSLKKIDLSSIKTGFVVTLTGRRTPVTVYLDRVRFVR